ncbi:MAG: amidohydrolase family protein [Lacrimispora sp.]|uniref:N-acetylglucosamine-6-phosphate deacetylase n=1 Tax=Lacrimispora sp. TaxID=2719234 RepID=UPI0039E6F4BD
MIIYSKHIILEQEEFDGFLEIEDGKVKALHEEFDGSYEDFSDFVVLPGFIDIHIHGWATGSFWFEKSAGALKEMSRTLPYAGVTSYLAASGADTLPEIKRSIEAADEAYEAGYAGAEMLGVHLEGPFINPQYRGMQREECCILPSLNVMEELYNTFRNKELCRYMTIAVELEGAREVLEFCKSHRIQTSIGHSAATFDQIKEIKDAGVGGFTHTFSGMRGFHHRELGVAGAALYFDDMMCEFAKQTGMTVSHEAFDIAYRIKGSGRIIMTTDCSGLAQTQTEFDHYVRKIKFIKDGDKVRIAHYDGREEWIDPRDYHAVKDVELSYIGSIQNMARHTRVDWFDIMRMTSLNPARYIHLDDRKGSIAPGKDADFTIVDEDLNLVSVFCRGKEMREGDEMCGK